MPQLDFFSEMRRKPYGIDFAGTAKIDYVIQNRLRLPNNQGRIVLTRTPILGQFPASVLFLRKYWVLKTRFQSDKMTEDIIS